MAARYGRRSRSTSTSAIAGPPDACFSWSVLEEFTDAERVISVLRRSGDIGTRPFVDIDLPAAPGEIAAVTVGVAHADFRLHAARRPIREHRHPFQRFGESRRVFDEKADVGDAMAS